MARQTKSKTQPQQPVAEQDNSSATETASDKQRPRYKFSAYYMKVSFFCAWIIIYTLVLGGLLGSDKADSLADLIVPAMVALIATLLGIHRAFGSLDYRSRGKRGD